MSSPASPPLCSVCPFLPSPLASCTDDHLFTFWMLVGRPRAKVHANAVTGGSKGPAPQVSDDAYPVHDADLPAPYSLGHYRSLVFHKYYFSVNERNDQQRYFMARKDWEHFVYVESGHLQNIDVSIDVEKLLPLCELHGLLWWAKSKQRLLKAGVTDVAATMVAEFLTSKPWLWSA
jgi:hypothetical protein